MLKIIKYTASNDWKHEDSIGGEFILTKFYAKSEFSKFLIVEVGGSRRFKYAIDEIEVYNFNGSAETFTNFDDLFARLNQLSYPAFYEDGQYIFNPNLYDLSQFQNNELDRFAKLSDITSSLNNKLDKNISNYTDATLPLLNTDELLVNRAGNWFKVDKSELGGAESEGYNPNGYIVPDYYLPFGWVQAGRHNFNLCSPTISGDVSVRMEGGTTIIFMFSEPKLISQIYYSPGYLGNPSTGGNIRNFLLKGTLTKGLTDSNLLAYPITLHDSNAGHTPMADYSSRDEFFHPFKKVVLNNPATVCTLIFRAQTLGSGTRAVIQRILFK